LNRSLLVSVSLPKHWSHVHGSRPASRPEAKSKPSHRAVSIIGFTWSGRSRIEAHSTWALRLCTAGSVGEMYKISNEVYAASAEADPNRIKQYHCITLPLARWMAAEPPVSNVEVEPLIAPMSNTISPPGPGGEPEFGSCDSQC
jgi:hypothetical protein